MATNTSTKSAASKSTTKTATSSAAKSKTAPKSAAAKSTKPAGATTSLRDADRSAFNPNVRALKKSVGTDLAHTFAHLAWTLTETDPNSVRAEITGNVRRNDAVRWLTEHKVIDQPITAQVEALVTALREAGADDAVVTSIAGHYGVADLI